MKNIQRSIVTVCYCIFLFLLASSTMAEDKSFAWQVQSDTANVYILGSIHYANKDFYPLSPAVENAFTQSSNLVLELNPIAANKDKVRLFLQTHGFYYDNQTILEHISSKTRTLLTEYTTSHNIQTEQLFKMKAPLISLQLTSLHLQKLGYLPEYGIDLHFAKRATGVKKIIELESIEEQLQMLFDIGDHDHFLQYTLTDLLDTENVMDQLVTAWKNGDHKSLDHLLLGRYKNNPQLAPIFTTLFDARNSTMTEKIEQLLKGEETSFAVIGAGHLVGDNGIINLLEKKGYDVKQM